MWQNTHITIKTNSRDTSNTMYRFSIIKYTDINYENTLEYWLFNRFHDDSNRAIYNFLKLCLSLSIDLLADFGYKLTNIKIFVEKSAQFLVTWLFLETYIISWILIINYYYSKLIIIIRHIINLTIDIFKQFTV